MGDKSAIEWTEATWNTVYGCTKVSPGCANCYIERTMPYRTRGLRFERGAILVQLLPERLEIPLRWKRPRMIFVNSLSDTFHEDVPDEYLDKMFLIMALAPQHTFQVLTKRPERMLCYVRSGRLRLDLELVRREYWRGGGAREAIFRTAVESGWPLPNVWLGVTVENQHFADERIETLQDTPAAVRFLSCEPLLGPINLHDTICRIAGSSPACGICMGDIQWVIAGGESAGPARRRLVAGPYHIKGHPTYLPTPTKHAWITSLRDQCQAAGVPFFFKQWGGPRPTSGGRRLEGRTWDEMPERQAVPS